MKLKTSNKKLDKLDSIKIKNFYISTEMIKKVKKQSTDPYNSTMKI